MGAASTVAWVATSLEGPAASAGAPAVATSGDVPARALSPLVPPPPAKRCEYVFRVLLRIDGERKKRMGLVAAAAAVAALSDDIGCSTEAASELDVMFRASVLPRPTDALTERSLAVTPAASQSRTRSSRSRAAAASSARRASSCATSSRKRSRNASHSGAAGASGMRRISRGFPPAASLCEREYVCEREGGELTTWHIAPHSPAAAAVRSGD